MPSALDIFGALMLQSTCDEETLTQIGHGLVTGNVIRHSGTYVKAQADTAANAEAVGIVRAVAGDEFTVVYSGRITGLSGLTAGTLYFLSEVTAGLLTSVEPSTAGVVSKPVLFATSNTSGIVINMRGTVLGSGGVIGQTYVSQQASSTTWTVQHNLGSLDIAVQCYDSSNQLFIPNTVTITDQNTVTLTFSTAQAGKAVVFAALGYTSGLQRGAADIRLDLNSTTSVKLTGIAGTSKRIEVNGYAVDCTIDKVCNKTDNLITAAGADATVAMSVSTFYYGYVSNHLATYAPNSLRFSTSAPVNGYISGNSNWRYVGDCYLESDGFFYDSDVKRLVRSEYNVIWKSLRAYNTTAQWTVGTGPQEFNAGAGQVKGYFIGDGKSSIVVTNWAESENYNNRVTQAGIGYDVTNAFLNGARSLQNMADVSYGASITCCMAQNISPTKARHFLTQIEASSGTPTYLRGNYISSGLHTLIPV
jgi:hypothetical protein